MKDSSSRLKTESVNKAMRELQAQLSQQIKKTAQAEKEKLRAMTLAGKEQVFRRAAEKAARAADLAAAHCSNKGHFSNWFQIHVCVEFVSKLWVYPSQ